MALALAVVALAAGPAPAVAGPVSPVLECVVDNGDGTVTAHWGYNNTSGVVQVIAVGDGPPPNKFSPAPAGRGQPTTFLIGRQYDVFTITFTPPTVLVWSLGTSTSTAGAGSAHCATPTATATMTGTATATATASVTFTATDTATFTATSTATATATSTATASATATDTATFTATATAADTTTATATASATPTITGTPVATPTATATATASATATATATSIPPSNTPTASATANGTVVAGDTVTPVASATPTTTPTATIPPLCPATPVAGCAPSVGFKRRLRLSDHLDIVTWRWRSSGTIPLADFGDPVTATDYAFCLYAGAPAALVMELRAPAGGICAAGKPCWKPRGVKGFRYKDLDATPTGITRIILRTKPQQLADLVLKARGPNIPFPALPLAQPVLAQLIRSDGPECWQNSYSAPAIKNTSDSYKDKND